MFLKTISLWEFNYGLFTNLPRIIVVYYFSPNSLKLRYPACSDRISIVTWKLLVIFSQSLFFWIKLIENLLLVKYLISVATDLKVRWEDLRKSWKFLMLLQEIYYNPTLAECMSFLLCKNTTYLIQLSQNKLIEVTGINTIQSNLIDKIIEVKFFSIMAVVVTSTID